TAVVVPPVPVNKAAPTVSGAAQQGQTLTEHNGDWTNSPTSYAYQWQQCDSSGNTCTDRTGAAKRTNEVAVGDVGHKLRVQEIASNEGGPSAPATSEATAVVVPPVPVNKAAPTVSGAAQQGQTLTEHNGDWTNSPTSYAYQWQQCDSSGNTCTVISGATNQTYEV